MSANGLWSHQQRGVERILANRSMMLAWEMGTGKTRTALEALRRLGARRTLVLAPLTVAPVWREQVERFAPELTPVILDRGSTKQRAANLGHVLAQDIAPRTLIALNYDAAWRSVLGAELLRRRWDALILDESHRIKSPTGRASRFAGALATRAQRVIALTATPMPHSPLDVWGQFRALSPRTFGMFTRFRPTYAIMGGHRVNGRPVQVVGFRNLDQLERLMAPIIDRVNIDDVLDLPNATHQRRVVRLPAAARQLYDQLEEAGAVEVRAGTVTAGNALVRLLRLAQVASGHVGLEAGGVDQVHGEKHGALTELLGEDLPATEPVVVFCRFSADVAYALEAARSAGRPAFELSGQRKELTEWKAAAKRGAVLAAQVQAGSLGVSMTEAAVAVWFSPTWSMGDYEQALGRLRRPGQTRPVTYVHIVAEDTVDEAVYDALARRADLVGAVMERLKRLTEQKEDSHG